MLQQKLNPALFNIDLLILNSSNVQHMRQVKRGNIFEPNSQVFDPLGLFSTDIFGPVGSATRSEMPAYIDLKLGILHPLVYEHILSLKSIYGEIFSGKTKAKFNTTLKDFEPDPNGRTGYEFFIQHLDKIKFTSNESDRRNYKLLLVKKYGNTEGLITKWLVTPAGIRDYTIDDKNQPSEDEVNGIYRKLIAATSLLENINLTPENIELMNPTRYKIQQLTVEIYEYFKTLLDGKNKFIQGKWAKRAVRYGTRNVLTPTYEYITDLKAENKISFNDTTIGVFQFAKSITPVVLNSLQNMFISRALSPVSDTAKVIDPSTSKPILVTIPVKKRDEWLTMDGLNNAVNKLSQDVLKEEPVMIDKYYLAMVYDNGKEVKVLFGDEDFDKYTPESLRPLTYVEMVYISLYHVRGKYGGLITRYPVAGLGGIYPSKFYVKTTTIGRTVNLSINNTEFTVYEYPILGKEYMNSTSVHYTHVPRLGADYDGDMVSANSLLTEESVKEIDTLFNNKSYYLTPDGNIAYSAKTNVLNFVLAHATDDA